MKTSEEMTKAVLMRVKVENSRRSRMRNGVLCTATGLCMAALALFGGVKLLNFWADTPPVLESEVTLPPVLQEPRIMLLHSTTVGKAEESMIAGVQVPQAFIRVRDITGMNADEVARACAEEEQYAKEFRVSSWYSGRMMFGGKRTLITIAHVGGLYVIPVDYEQVVDYSVETTKIGSAIIHRNPVKINGSDEVRTGLEVCWRFSDWMIDEIDQDPSMDLTEFRDTITVTVNFLDGSTEIVTIDMVIDNDGNLYAVYVATEIQM